jgi:uncharacterized protein YceH (UPF0502 family)
MHAFATPEEVEAALASLGDPTDALVVQLDRQPGQKGARFAQVLVESNVPAASDPDELAALRAEVVALRAEVLSLRAALADQNRGGSV